MGKRGRPRVQVAIPPAVVARYRSGELTIAGVAAWCGLSYPTTRAKLRELGEATSRRGRRKLDGAKEGRIAFSPAHMERYAKGELDHNDLARLYRASGARVLRELRRAGADTSIGTRKRLQSARRTAVANLEAVIVDLYRCGRSTTAIAEQIGWTAEGVRQLLLRQGVILRPPGPEPGKPIATRAILDR
jgi:hypothetical protein